MQMEKQNRSQNATLGDTINYAAFCKDALSCINQIISEQFNSFWI